MRLFKTIDLWIQVLIIPIGLIIAITRTSDEFLFGVYFAVGGWQMFSAITHLFFQSRYLPLKSRKYYTFIAIAMCLGLFYFSFRSPINIEYGMFMLIVSPFMALWYVYISYAEKRRLEYKQLVHLK